EIYAIDLKGNARTSGERRRREGGNVFSDQIRVGVAIYFLVRKEGEKGCRIWYNAVEDYVPAEDKKAYLHDNQFADLKFQPIHPDKTHNWLNLAESDWDELIPIASKEAKTRKGAEEQRAIFKLFSLGVVTNRDEWVYSEAENELQEKVRYLIGFYNAEVIRRFVSTEGKDLSDGMNNAIKWTRAVKKDLITGKKYEFEAAKIIDCLYRPFAKRKLYFDHGLNEMQYRMPAIFPAGKGKNLIICMNIGDRGFSVLGSKYPVDLHFTGDSQCLPLYAYGETGERMDNISDLVLRLFRERFPDLGSRITKDRIFHYIYAVLHNPVYRHKYAVNLKREFPRIPFYDDFEKWAEWGRQLMDLHLNYEQVEPYKLTREDKDPQSTRKAIVPRLIARKETGEIEIDTLTTLRGVPPEAWDYRLVTYTALEWVLERYKERKPKDPTIREKFNTYRFADYKEHVIDLLRRVCTVSVETTKIVHEMPK
ncbi:MAG: type ISP restriction/modification enzyme, partial [Candidatus Krumholzibacteriia bacterium]